ncbi:MAG: MoxR family ATPase [Lentisphaeria bacterium]|nr:MoxR family ATPase [Lentisphaeria bacterium]
MTNEQNKTWESAQAAITNLREEVARTIVDQRRVIDEMLMGLMCRGHCLMVGVPGLAKTLLVDTLGKCLGLSFHRVQFTPDLMPADIIGSEILQQTADGSRHLEFTPGPVFANLILADEINRTPPKTQSALLEAMQEKQVTVAGKTMPLPDPFLVFATQNPIEHEGTYPLPEAQLDRFFFNIVIDYPGFEQEREIVLRTTARERATPAQVLNPEQIAEMQEMIFDIPAPDHVIDAILKITHGSRPTSDLADDFIRRCVEWGAGPRASQTLTLAAKACAFIKGEAAASLEDVREVAMPALRHRVLPSYSATGDGVTVEKIIQHLLDKHLG